MLPWLQDGASARSAPPRSAGGFAAAAPVLQVLPWSGLRPRFSGATLRLPPAGLGRPWEGHHDLGTWGPRGWVAPLASTAPLTLPPKAAIGPPVGGRETGHERPKPGFSQRGRDHHSGPRRFFVLLRVSPGRVCNSPSV